MLTNCEEPEIKIEYNESYDEDPLILLSKENGKFENCSNEKVTAESPWYKTTNNGKYLCRFCDCPYSTIQTLQYHTKTKHSEDGIQIEKDLDSKKKSRIKCHICNERFPSTKYLKEHVRIKHVTIVQTSCFSCQATFQSKGDLFWHLFHSHNIKQSALYSCIICGYRTYKLSHFKQHKNVHDKRNMHKCQYCAYSTNHSANLKVHERLHTNSKPYACDFKDCNYKCASKSALTSHQLRHNRDNNFVYCDKCNYRTIYRQSLTKHLNSHKRNTIKLRT